MASARLIQDTIPRGHGITRLPVALLLLLFARPAYSQGNSDVYWHTDPGVKTCSMVIDPSLTQDQWHTFVEQAGAAFGALPEAIALELLDLQLQMCDQRLVAGSLGPQGGSFCCHRDQLFLACQQQPLQALGIVW